MSNEPYIVVVRVEKNGRKMEEGARVQERMDVFINYIRAITENGMVVACFVEGQQQERRGRCTSAVGG